MDDEGIKKITELCNLVYDTGYLPPDMSSSIFVILPKKAKTTECSDYRKLSLMSHNAAILYTKVILKRNKHKIESVISETQSGFMAGKGTREGIYNLRTIIERYVKCWKNISLFHWLWKDFRQSQTWEYYRMHEKPRHRCERNKLDKKFVLESKSIHENRRRVVAGNSHQNRSTRRLCVITLSV